MKKGREKSALANSYTCQRRMFQASEGLFGGMWFMPRPYLKGLVFICVTYVHAGL